MSQQYLMVVAVVAAFSLALSSETTKAQDAAFGFPSGGSACSTGGCGTVSYGAQQRAAGFSQLSQRWRSTQDQNEKIYARNAAWPKPFACASRQHYHNIWRSMYDAGWQDQCILTPVHFDENGELTRYGKNQISGMMTNMPRGRRTIFIQELANSEDTNVRVAKVQEVLQTWYPQRGGMVQVSSRPAVTMNGVTAARITENSLKSAPSPIIPIADGTTGVSNAVNQ